MLKSIRVKLKAGRKMLAKTSTKIVGFSLLLITFYLAFVFLAFPVIAKTFNCPIHPDNKECDGVKLCVVECKDGFVNKNGSVSFKAECLGEDWDQKCEPAVSFE